MKSWSVDKSSEVYGIKWWGAGLFAVSPSGTITVTPKGPTGPKIDLLELSRDLEERGIRMPITIRFQDILHYRVDLIAQCFHKAIEENKYPGKYAGVYPIKVNQQRHVVKELMRAGQKSNLGLECGSKPELLVVLSQMRNRDALVVCNGFKDQEYIETAVLAQKLGFKIILVVDRMDELPKIIEVCQKYNSHTWIGFRAKLYSKASGMWVETSGTRSKFGLTPSEMVDGVELLRDAGMLDSLKLLHYHIGSQIPSIQYIKKALREGARFYCELSRMGAPMGYLDVGGGLGIDYDGSGASDSSTNYTEQEYANDVIYVTGDICREMNVVPPDIVTESGRALTAHHSVLIYNVLGRNTFRNYEDPEPPSEADHATLKDLHYIYKNLQLKNLNESFNDLDQLNSDIQQLFSYGVLDLKARARAENLYWAISTKMEQVAREAKDGNDEAADIYAKLQSEMSDLFFCNFSVFQSLPDAWALGQTFPVMPIQRLDEEPDRQATIGDLTCDSDGKLDHFICSKTWKGRRTLPVHDIRPHEPYFMAVFLTGAYQEILGDLHNLFGDTDAVSISATDDGYQIDHVIQGDTIEEILSYLEYPKEKMIEAIRKAAEESLRTGEITKTEVRLLMRHYEENLKGYTYLEEAE